MLLFIRTILSHSSMARPWWWLFTHGFCSEFLPHSTSTFNTVQALSSFLSLGFRYFHVPWLTVLTTMFQIVKIILIYAWMKVANIVRNPFGLDDHYDINLEEMLDHNIWKASVSIKHMDNPIYLHWLLLMFNMWFSLTFAQLLVIKETFRQTHTLYLLIAKQTYFKLNNFS